MTPDWTPNWGMRAELTSRRRRGAELTATMAAAARTMVAYFMMGGVCGWLVVLRSVREGPRDISRERACGKRQAKGEEGIRIRSA